MDFTNNSGFYKFPPYFCFMFVISSLIIGLSTLKTQMAWVKRMNASSMDTNVNFSSKNWDIMGSRGLERKQLSLFTKNWSHSFL